MDTRHQDKGMVVQDRIQSQLIAGVVPCTVIIVGIGIQSQFQVDSTLSGKATNCQQGNTA